MFPPQTVEKYFRGKKYVTIHRKYQIGFGFVKLVHEVGIECDKENPDKERKIWDISFLFDKKRKEVVEKRAFLWEREDPNEQTGILVKKSTRIETNGPYGSITRIKDKNELWRGIPLTFPLTTKSDTPSETLFSIINNSYNRGGLLVKQEYNEVLSYSDNKKKQSIRRIFEICWGNKNEIKSWTKREDSSEGDRSKKYTAYFYKVNYDQKGSPLSIERKPIDGTRREVVALNVKKFDKKQPIPRGWSLFPIGSSHPELIFEEKDF